METPTATTAISNRELLKGLLDTLARADGSVHEVLDAAAVALVAFTPNRTITYANEPAERLLGYGRRELEGAAVDVLVPQRLRQQEQPPQRVTPDVMQVEIPALTKDGRELPAEWAVGGVEVPGTGSLFLTAVRDVASVVQAHEELRRSEERFRLLIDGVRDYAIFLLDPEGRVVTWNGGAERIMGYSASDIIGQHFERLYPDDEVRSGAPRRLLTQAIESGRAELEVPHVRRDGTPFLAEVVLTALRDGSGRHIGFAKVTRDLTDRRVAAENAKRLQIEQSARSAAERAEVRAHEQARRTRVLADASKYFAAADLDFDGTLVEFARQCVELLGDGCAVSVPLADGAVSIRAYVESDPDANALAQTLIGERVSHDGMVTKILRTDRPVIVPQVTPSEIRAMAGQRFLPLLDRFPVFSLLGIPLRAGGRVLAVAMLARHCQGAPFGASDLVLVEDLADRVGLALENSRLYQELKVAVQAREELLAVVSHDLRSPLTTITLSAALIVSPKVEGDASKVIEHATRIQRAARRMNRLVGDLLDRARSTSGRQIAVDPTPQQDVHALLREAATEFELVAAGRSMHLDLQLPAEPMPLACDYDRMLQVFANILSNALRHSEDGAHIALKAERHGANVLFIVKDQGSGIPPEVMPRIFDPYWQEGEAQHGLGLGLPVSREIVEAHGGRIWAESEPGRGSAFFISLPAMTGHEAGAPVAATSPAFPAA